MYICRHKFSGTISGLENLNLLFLYIFKIRYIHLYIHKTLFKSICIYTYVSVHRTYVSHSLHVYL